VPSVQSILRSPRWQKALQAAADCPRAKRFLESLAGTSWAPDLARASSEHARVLVALLSGSQALSERLLAHPDWRSVLLNVEGLARPRHEQGLQREINDWLQPALRTRAYADAFTRLRRFNNANCCALRRATWRGWATPRKSRANSRMSPTPACARSANCANNNSPSGSASLITRNAEGHWQPTKFAVLAWVSWGDRNSITVPTWMSCSFTARKGPSSRNRRGPGAAASDQALSNHQFFKRLAEAFIAEVTQQTPEGMLYRIDLRLRPEGDTGPLVRSLGSFENYYAQWGQTWERLMLIKTRGVAGNPVLAAEYLEMIQPFRYPRFLHAGVMREVAAVKDRIEAEVVRAGELDRNVKLGRGGIREIEFVVQTQQLLHAGRIPFCKARKRCRRSRSWPNTTS